MIGYYCDGALKTVERGYVIEETAERVVLFDDEVEVQAGTEYFIQFETYKGIRTKNDVLKQIDPAAAHTDLLPLLPASWSL